MVFQSRNTTQLLQLIGGMVKRSGDLDLEAMLILRNKRRKMTCRSDTVDAYFSDQESENAGADLEVSRIN